MLRIREIGLLAVGVSSLIACSEKRTNPNSDVVLTDFASMRVSDYVVSLPRLRNNIARQISEDHDTLAPDYFLRKYYQQGNSFLWVDRKGIDYRADSLLLYLRQVDKIGFNCKRFRVSQIEADIERLRNLQFDTVNTASMVVARLEYNLTKSYLRYVTGQRFGYVNPYTLLNHIDLVDTAHVGRGYRTLFDVQMETPNRRFFLQALSKVRADSVTVFLQEVQPIDTLYNKYFRMLQSTSSSSPLFAKIMVNMERSRWRTGRKPNQYNKYVIVNVPSYMLQAVDGTKSLNMRVGLGAVTTKTPLLNSDIYRMDFNPQWIIPKSIVRHNVVKHVGDSTYFVKNNYFVRERSTGKVVKWPYFTADMLLSSAYAVIQRGGEGNSLGRVIFRFANPFSVYLHDTPSQGFFSRSIRAVSHGCVRVERPYDLALFLLGDEASSVKYKIQYTMTAHTSHNAVAEKDTLRRNLIIGSKNLEPVVPLFITYYTLYPNAQGHMCEYSDIYGYDAVINNYLCNYR